MQYWNYLDRTEDDDHPEDSTLGEVQSDFDGAGTGKAREANPRQQFFDFGEMLNPPPVDFVDRLSGYEEVPEEPAEGSVEPVELDGPDYGRRAENDLGGRHPFDRNAQ